MVLWLKATSLFFGVPVAHWVFIFFGLGAIVEFILGRSKNPKYRSLAGTLFSWLGKLCAFAHIDQLPVVKQVLAFLSPPADDVPPAK
jgi:hypothetical protein